MSVVVLDGGSSHRNNDRLWLLVWTAPYGISVPE